MADNSNEPTIFIVSEYVDPKVNSTGYYWSRIVNGVSLVFSRTAVICPESSSMGQYPFDSQMVSIYPISKSNYKKNHLLYRLMGLLNLSFKFFIQILHRLRKNDLIFSGTNPIFLVLCIAITKRLIHFKWVLLVHDVFPNNLSAAGILKKSNLLYRLLDSLFSWAYRSADALIVIGRDMEVLFRQKGITDGVFFQPNWVNKHEILPIDRNESTLIHSLGWGNRVVFQFFGNAGRLQGIDNLLSAIDLVKDPRAAFLFIGEGSEFAAIQRFAKVRPQLPVAVIANKDLESRSIGLCACDVAIVSLKLGMQGIGVPSKSYFSLAADRPILGVVDATSELAQMIQENEGIGWHCDPENPQILASQIDAICNIDITLNAGKARALMENKYDEVIAIKGYIDTLQLVLSGAS